MKKILVLSLFLIFGFFLTLSTYAQEEKVEKSTETTGAVQTNVQTEVQAPIDMAELNAICPVSGEPVDEEVTYEYNGKTYALCCKTCLKKFKANPEKYIGRLSEDGKSLKKKSEG